MKIRSPYGGLIIIRGGHWKTDPPVNTIKLTLENVAQAPHYKAQDPGIVAQWDTRCESAGARSPKMNLQPSCFLAKKTKVKMCFLLKRSWVCIWLNPQPLLNKGFHTGRAASEFLMQASTF